MSANRESGRDGSAKRGGGPPPSQRQRRLGQNFLADPNLLDLIIREAAIEPGDVLLEVGGGAGALTERLALLARHLHVIEADERLRGALSELAGGLPNVGVVWGDALRIDLEDLDPAPTRLVSNLPYSIATPLLLRTIFELPSIGFWLAMVQVEIAERLVANPGTREYGRPSVLAQLTCEVELVRRVDPAVFTPRPRVGSALIRITRRRRPPPPPALRSLVRDGFAHRRKSLARSLELAAPGRIEPAREALRSLGLPADARAEALSPDQFEQLAAHLAGSDP